MNDIRSLQVYADGLEVGQGCPISLVARKKLSLRPALHRLEIMNLSESSKILLAEAKGFEVRSDDSILSAGEKVEVFTRKAAGQKRTEVVFSPGFSFWQSTVAVSLAGGIKVSDSISALLEKSGCGVRLAVFTAEDAFLTRPQVFFGRTCDAVTLLAETARADACLTAAGICVCGRSKQEAGAAGVIIPETEILAEPIRVRNRLILATQMIGWPMGSCCQVEWQGQSWTGRIVGQMIQASNREGCWKTELEMDLK